jgi:RND family efflux transporter MFP subunit
MKKESLCIFLLVILVGLGVSGCRGKSIPEPRGKVNEDPVPSAVVLTAEALQTAGIRVAKAEWIAAVEESVIPGKIVLNPKRLAHVTARTSGRIERVFSYPGENVVAGQTLLTLYSPDFLALQAELLQSLQRTSRFQADSRAKNMAQILLDSARKKLRLLGLLEDEIGRIEQSGSMESLLSVRSPLAGRIIESSATVGDFVELGVGLFKVANLSTVWAVLQLYERNIAQVRPGQRVSIRTAALPNREFLGKIFQLGSQVDEHTRTVEGLVELANPEGNLRQGMYVEASVRFPRTVKSLFIPDPALQDFESKKIVFIPDESKGFHLREVEIGISAGGRTEIIKGLLEGESVVTHGAFFLKSELLKKRLGEE